MIYLTQLIYVRPGEEAVFNEFESYAIPIISKYHGELVLRIRPEPDRFIAGTVEPPYEIHLVSFKSEADFQAFAQDEERKRFLHLKEQSIRSSLLIRGELIG